MVTKYGMSEDVGLVFHDLRGNDTSAITRKTIDDEVKKLCDASYQRAKSILVSKNDDLEKLAKALLEYETLSGAEIEKIIKGEPLDRKPIDLVLTSLRWLLCPDILKYRNRNIKILLVALCLWSNK
ncbi:atp-dependent metalloprotease [Plasmopara halstedii]|uniref:Atp-dependent metalloprotease n=1 Tax=Plasmopara halstedii TaxID=4781 RepID=A0A0P1AAA3_PLAHL|nr:atp-dependent metalloprotease [Plasmopara halstedii]CEG37486.1 atp-dependent metalloprotease [Plasmopara halstedii]|eukprot:XP_024573855.1 atp-dependent metalloprotease [Plasmopara halstedii]